MESCSSATQAPEIELQISRVREICNSVADRTVQPCTFSRWCDRVGVLNEASSYTPLNKAAALVTFAGLQRLGIKEYGGLAYQKSYPIAYQKLKDHLEQDIPLYA